MKMRSMVDLSTGKAQWRAPVDDTGRTPVAVGMQACRSRRRSRGPCVKRELVRFSRFQRLEVKRPVSLILTFCAWSASVVIRQGLAVHCERFSEKQQTRTIDGVGTG